MHGVSWRAREGSYRERGPDGGDILVVPDHLGLSPLLGVTKLEMLGRQWGSGPACCRPWAGAFYVRIFLVFLLSDMVSLCS